MHSSDAEMLEHNKLLIEVHFAQLRIGVNYLWVLF